MGFLDSIVDLGTNIIGGILSESGKEDPVHPNEVTVKPSTVSGQDKSLTDILYDEQALKTLTDFSAKLAGWGDLDRDFMENTYRPFQEDLIATNTQLLNLIGKNANLSLEQSIKDLTGSDALKTVFRSTVMDQATNISDTAQKFRAELDNLPTVEQRIGQAASAVEQQFGRAAADIRGRLKAQGRNISQATERDLAIQKATAKAGAVGAAGEAARRERMEALGAGVGVFSNLQASQAQQLLSQQQQAQGGVGLTNQVGGVTLPTDSSTKMAADLTGATGLQQRGVGTTGQSINTTQAGVTSGNFPLSDVLFDGSGNVTDQFKDLESTLTAGELAELKTYAEGTGGSGGTGSYGGSGGGSNLKESNPGLYGKLASYTGTGAGALAGFLTGSTLVGGAVKKGVDSYMGSNTTEYNIDPFTGLPTTQKTRQGVTDKSNTWGSGGDFGTYGGVGSRGGMGDRDAGGYGISG